MMRLVSIAFLFLYALHDVQGQDPFKVLDWKGEQTVHTYLMKIVHSQFDERRQRFRLALRNQTSAYAYRDSVRSSYKRLIGHLPSRTPLKAKTLGTIDAGTYIIEKIVFESVPGHHVTTNLYLPSRRNGRVPGVLLLCGHEDESKATVSYQKTAALFAINGFAVMVVDPMSESERHQLTDSNGKPMTRGGTTEHTLINAAANLVGSGTVALQLWDNIRALDYLCERKEVDPDKIGCLGNSGGGTQTAYLIAYDERVKVASVCSYLTSRERTLELSGPNDGCQHVIGEGSAFLEMSDFLISFAPKPLIVLAGSYDFVDYKGTEEAFAEVSSFYKTIGHSDRVSLFTAEDGHGITKPKRERVVSFFIQMLSGADIPVKEGDIKTFTPDQLFASGKPQVNLAYPSETNDFKRVLQVSDALKKQSDLRGSVLKLNGIVEPVRSSSIEEVGVVDVKEFRIKKIILRDSTGVPLPLLIADPGDATNIEIRMSENGKRSLVDSTALLEKSRERKTLLILADISGTGELRDQTSANDPKYFNREYRLAMLALHTGTSLPSIRTKDVLRVVHFARSLNDKSPIQLFADGFCTLPALQAAVIDDKIVSVNISNGPSSFKEAITDPLRKNWYSIVIPKVLGYYDIGDLRAHLKNRLIETPSR